MGSSASAYRVKAFNSASLDGEKSKISDERLEWIASPATKIFPFRNENFERIKPIGKGKFGLVFLTKHTAAGAGGSTSSAANVGKYVAVKYIPKTFIHEHQSVERIQQELNVLRVIKHPFLIHCFGAFESHACVAMVFEYAYGGELYNKMKRDIKFSEEVAKFYFCEMALALHYLHDEANIVYRDIKPENILIDKHGHVRLCDFGFAVPLRKVPVSSLPPRATLSAEDDATGGTGLGLAGLGESVGFGDGMGGLAGLVEGITSLFTPNSSSKIGVTLGTPVASSRHGNDHETVRGEEIEQREVRGEGRKGDSDSVGVSGTDRAAAGIRAKTVGSPSGRSASDNGRMGGGDGQLPAELLDGCGTAMYVAPEIAGGFMRGGHGFPVDWWSLGCVLMEMVTGNAPFGDSDRLNKFEIFNNITHKPLSLPVTMGASLKTLLRGLLHKDPQQRVCWQGVYKSAWLKDVVWDDVYNKRVRPPWIPPPSSKPNTDNFVEWDLMLPKENPPINVAVYCSALKIPKPVFVVESTHGRSQNDEGKKCKSSSSMQRASSSQLRAGNTRFNSDRGYQQSREDLSSKNHTIIEDGRVQPSRSVPSYAGGVGPVSRANGTANSSTFSSLLPNKIGKGRSMSSGVDDTKPRSGKLESITQKRDSGIDRADGGRMSRQNSRVDRGFQGDSSAAPVRRNSIHVR